MSIPLLHVKIGPSLRKDKNMYRTLRSWIWVVALIVPMACTHSSPTSSDVKTVEGEKSDCHATPLCTMELAPQICTYEGKTFEANNRCQTLNLARAYACEQKLAFVEEKVECKAHPALQVEGAGPCGRRMICPREYEPHVCTVGSQKIKGPSQCEALNKAREFACEKGIKFVAEDVKCEMESKLPKKK